VSRDVRVSDDGVHVVDAEHAAHPLEPSRMALRRASVHLPASELAAFLRLPEGVRVVALRTDLDTLGIVLYVEGESLAEVPEGAHPPLLAGGGRWVLPSDEETRYVRVWDVEPQRPR
jgi:hypothetical protein